MYYEVFVNARSAATTANKKRALEDAAHRATKAVSVVVTENAGKPNRPPNPDAPPTTIAQWHNGKKIH